MTPEQTLEQRALQLRTDMSTFLRRPDAYNAPKVEQRRLHLATYPGDRIRINYPRLKSVIDYADFKCSPLSSIARDEAIKGSDIDGGLIILKEPVSKDAQLAFVRELRTQGFSAYLESEVDDIDRQLAKTKRLKKRHNLYIEKFKRQENVIHFLTQEELDGLWQYVLTHEGNPIEGYAQLMMYVGGTSLK